MTREQRITALAQGIATTMKGVNGKIGVLSELSTTQKGSIVAALNELKGLVDSAAGGGVVIDDATASSAATYSSTKINSQINAAIAALINGANTNSDTLKELADAIAALAQADNGLVGVAAQSFTAPQKAQARTNIGAAAADDVAALTTGVGNTDHDFVADFNTQYLS